LQANACDHSFRLDLAEAVEIAVAVAHEQVVLEWLAEETRHCGTLWGIDSPLSGGIVVAS
jgi:hypothetical protein